MDEEDDDDLYPPEEAFTGGSAVPARSGADDSIKRDPTNAEEDEEEGEEVEEDGSDSDIDIITERKGGPEPKAESTQAPRAKEPKVISASAPVVEPSPASRDSIAIKGEAPGRETQAGRPGSSYPAVKSSTIDVDAKPIYEPAGKSITDMDMDADFPEDDKPWRRPGTDVSDYFNYGFDEFTWASYCLKQQTLRKEVTDTKKQMDDMQSFMNNGIPGMPGMPGPPPGGATPSMPSMGGPTDLPPEMQQLFQQMMAQGLDPMTMGPEQMMQMMQGGGMGDQNQGFGGQGFAQQGQGGHQMGYGGGYGGGGGGGGSGGGGGHQGNRGRGRGRW